MCFNDCIKIATMSASIFWIYAVDVADWQLQSLNQPIIKNNCHIIRARAIRTAKMQQFENQYCETLAVVRRTPGSIILRSEKQTEHVRKHSATEPKNMANINYPLQAVECSEKSLILYWKLCVPMGPIWGRPKPDRNKIYSIFLRGCRLIVSILQQSCAKTRFWPKPKKYQNIPMFLKSHV